MGRKVVSRAGWLLRQVRLSADKKLRPDLRAQQKAMQMKLQFPAALQRAHEGGVVGKFQMTAHGDTVGQAGDLHPKGL